MPVPSAVQGKYNVVSCSVDAVENGSVRLSDYDAVDVIAGLEENDGHSLVSYKSFTTALQQKLSDYVSKHGRLFVSGLIRRQRHDIRE